MASQTRWWVVCSSVAAAAALLWGCSGGAGSAGLSNAPGGTRPWGPEDRDQDAIANGPRSCPPEGKTDPLPNRTPACVESARPAASGKPPAR